MSRITVLKNEFGHLEYELYEGNYFIHCTISKWNRLLYESYKIVFDNWLHTLHRDLGVKVVFVASDVGNSKLQRFEKMFGFVEVNRDDQYVLLARNIEDIEYVELP